MWTYRLGLERSKRLLLTGDALDGRTRGRVGAGLARPCPRTSSTPRRWRSRGASRCCPANQLQMMKLLVNQAFEQMGLHDDAADRHAARRRRAPHARGRGLHAARAGGRPRGGRRARRAVRRLRPGAGVGVAQPPMAHIVRSGWTKPGSLTWCLSSLRHTASRMICSSSSSSAPARSGPRRSVSLSENRHVRSRPSAVRRMRLQSPQNGSETGLMKPMRAAAVGEAVDARGGVTARAARAPAATLRRSPRGSPRR